MATVIGTIGPLSVDANNSQVGPMVWRHRQTIAATDTLTLTYLGRARHSQPLSVVGGACGIIETIAIQKTLPADVIPVTMQTYPASLGATGVPIGGSIAGEAGARVGAGQVWLSSVSGTLFPAEELIIDNSTGADSVDVMVIVREDM
jgi:hypothetical protein